MFFIVSDPLGEDDIDLNKLFGEHGERSLKQKKRCPDCYAPFASEFQLFNHRINECKPKRSISLIKVSNVNAPVTSHQFVTAEYAPDEDSTVDSIDSKKKLECQGCGTKFQRAYYMSRHKRVCKEYQKLAKHFTPDQLAKEQSVLIVKHTCNDCGIVFTRPSSLKRHLASTGCIKRQHFKQYTCSICMRTLTSKESLRNHKLRFCPGLGKSTNSDEPLFTCKGCGTSFNKKFCLIRHQSNTCPALKVLSKAVCYVCSTAFETFELLKEHLKDCHQDQ